MNAILVVAGLVVGQAQPSDAYANAYWHAVETGRPLVIGVGCVPPPGAWDVLLLSKMDGYSGPIKAPAIVVTVPTDGKVCRHATLGPTASPKVIQQMIDKGPVQIYPHRQEDVRFEREKAVPDFPKKYNPAAQQPFQPKMDRRQRVYYTTPLIAPRYSNANC